MAKLYVKMPVRVYARVLQDFPDREVEVARTELGTDLVLDLPPGQYRVMFCRTDEDGIEYSISEQDAEIRDYPVYEATILGFRHRDDLDLPV